MRYRPDAHLRELSHRQAVSRREFLRVAAGSAAAGATFFGPVGGRALTAMAPVPKVVVVTFGGGARDQETFAQEGQQYIPHLLADLIPRATFYTQVVNRGILGHYVATAGLATGVYEHFNNFAPVSPYNPTLFEYYRHDLRRPATDAWVIAPSNGFQRIGESSHRLYGSGLGATVVLPKQLLATHAPTGEAAGYQRLMRDSYESPVTLPDDADKPANLHQLAALMQLSVADFLAHARTISSPDELSLYIAQHVMDRIAPSLLWITLHDIDVAHSGAFSLYTDAIRRSDRICAALWQTIETLPEYKGRTRLFILPDFGRDGDTEPSGNGFQHHRTGDALSRTTWLMALGRGIPENRTVDRPVESVDLVPTLAHILGCNARFAQGHPLSELLV